MRRLILPASLAVAAIVAGAPPALAAPILTNGSFETGNFSGWTQSGNTGATFVETGPFAGYPGAEDGAYYAALGPVGSQGGLEQTVATTPSDSYTLNFWLNAHADSSSNFSALWNGSPLLSLTTPITRGWTLFSFPVTGTGSDMVGFSFRDDPSYIGLDNVSLDPSTVPEPATLVLLGGGLIVAAMRRRLNAVR